MASGFHEILHSSTSNAAIYHLCKHFGWMFSCALNALFFAVVVLAGLQGAIPGEATANWWINLIANYIVSSFEGNGWPLSSVGACSAVKIANCYILVSNPASELLRLMLDRFLLFSCRCLNTLDSHDWSSYYCASYL